MNCISYCCVEGRTMEVSVDPSTVLILDRDPDGLECEVCTTVGSTTDCSPSHKMLTNADKQSLEFSCPKPQDMYIVKIKKGMGESKEYSDFKQ